MEYSVILADPPWRYYQAANWRLRRRGIDLPNNHYDTLTIPQIKALPIGDLAGENAALFLWITMPLLTHAEAVCQSWGFRFVTTAFTWAKVNKDGSPYKGLGQYTRANAELCILGLRGKMKPLSRSVNQLIISCPREHSRKPDEQYGRIMRLFAGPYLEVFGRQCWPGWDVWGNQTGKFAAQPPLIPEVA